MTPTAARKLANIHIDPQCAAEAADLVYVTDDEPGISRRRFGKGFAYYLPGGKKIGPGRHRDRIDALAVPPAYEDVWICVNPLGHLQATGRDDRGRKQYRYHDRWAEVRDRAKFAKLRLFGDRLPSIRRRVRKDLKATGLPREKVLAACIRLLDQTHIRIGNADYAKQNNSFGLTTLQDGHATFHRGTVRFEFRAKHGIEVELEVRDSQLARIVKQCQDLPGQELLQYLDDVGNVVDIGSSDVNDYLHEITGEHVTAKDFRTWHASVLGLGLLRKVEPAESKTAINKQIVAVIDEVATSLGNTRAVCRKCYVHPGVVETFEQGKLAEVFKKTPKTIRELSKDECALMHFL